jgi:hypothetical protein
MIIPTIRDVDVSATGLTTFASVLFEFCSCILRFNDQHSLMLYLADLYYPFTIKDLHPDSKESHWPPVVLSLLFAVICTLLTSARRQAYRILCAFSRSYSFVAS